jgi:hypothetical protein
MVQAVNALRVRNVLYDLINTAPVPTYVVNPRTTTKTIPEKDYSEIEHTKDVDDKQVPIVPHECFIPLWHGSVAYSPSFTGNAIEKLEQASCNDLARYLKVIGFKKVHVTKSDAAKLVVVGILAAKKKNELNRETNAAIMCGGMTDKWYNRLPGTPCEDTRLLKEILCCMEMAYVKLQKNMETYYKTISSGIAGGSAVKPIFGLSLTSDCGPRLYQTHDDRTGDPGLCIPIPDTMIAVFGKEAASIEAGQRTMKQLFTGIIYAGHKEQEALFHFSNIAYLQRQTYAKLCTALKEKVYDVREGTLKFLGGTSGNSPAARTMKKLCAGILEHGELVFGPVSEALGFLSNLVSDEGEVVVTPLAHPWERVAFWIVSHLDIFYDVSCILKRCIIDDFCNIDERIVLKYTSCEGLITTLETRKVPNPSYNARAVSPLPGVSATIPYVVAIPSWDDVSAENHAVVKAIIVDLIATIEPGQSTPALAEAISLLTAMVQAAVDHAARAIFVSRDRTLKEAVDTFQTNELLDSPNIAAFYPELYEKCVTNAGTDDSGADDAVTKKITVQTLDRDVPIKAKTPMTRRVELQNQEELAKAAAARKAAGK